MVKLTFIEAQFLVNMISDLRDELKAAEEQAGWVCSYFSDADINDALEVLIQAINSASYNDSEIPDGESVH